MRRKTVKRVTAAAMRVLLVCCLLALPGLARGDAGGAAPPRTLIEAGLLAGSESEPTQRSVMSWERVQATTPAMVWPEPARASAEALSPDSAEWLKQAEDAMNSGEAFGAIELLRLAMQSDPGHRDVQRALGLAYAESGNLHRAAAYLGPIAAADRDDAEALLVLTRHAAQSEPIERVIAYCAALSELDGAAALADAYRAAALNRLGYNAAAAERLTRAVQAFDAMADDDDAAGRREAFDMLSREIEVIEAMLPQLRIDLGDYYLRAGRYDSAAKAYGGVALQDPAARHLLGARRVYLGVLVGDAESAIDHAIALLEANDATLQDASLIDYLVVHGVSRAALAPRVTAVLDERGVDRPRLVALSRVADKPTVLARVGQWLGGASVTAQRLEQAVSLVSFDDTEPADARALSALLGLIAEAIERSPSEALSLARAAIGPIDAPVTLLRAIRSAGYAAEASEARRLLAAAAYEAVGRRRDAATMYAALLSSESKWSDQVLLPAVRLQLALGMRDGPKALMGEPDLAADWPRFDLSVRALAAAGEAAEALDAVERYIAANGQELRSSVLRIELIAEMGEPQEACNLLLRLISTHPDDESLYRLGIDLAFDHRASFSRVTDADRMRRAFLTRLMSNLPRSPLARIGAAQNLRSNPSRIEEAQDMLLGVLEEDPSNALALSLLVELYDDVGDEVSAQAMHERYAKAVTPGVPRALLLAERALANGRAQQVLAVLDRALELDREGVLPGPAMRADQASAMLRHIEAAAPDRDLDPLYTEMVKRFPDHPGLNNALGYRWAVGNKNLRQAKAMIQRAIAQDPTSYSLLDSLAWTQYKLGEFQAAYATQARALALLDAEFDRFPGLDRDMGATIAVLNDHMGDILYKLDDPDQALGHWRKAQKQNFTEEEMLFDPELRTMAKRLKDKIAALADNRPVPVAQVPGPEAHGPAGHPADVQPGE